MSVDLKVVDRYCRDVTSGKIPAGKYTRLAVERHLRDLETGKERGLKFSKKAAQHVLDFCELCRHYKGKWAGERFVPAPWQAFILACQFGWQRADGLRRFRTAVEFVARKNGKTFKAGVVGNYGLTCDGEPGAEIYSAATKKDQARILWNDARRMVLNSPELSLIVEPGKTCLTVESTFSKFEPLSSDDSTLDGLNVHFGLIDEVHAHKSRGVYDIIDTATGSREQPQLNILSTTGVYRECIGYELYEYTCRVLEGVIEDDSWFGIIFGLDEGDDPFDPDVWIKANPNLGVSKFKDDLERKAKRARNMPGYYNTFLCKELNKWVQQLDRWIDLEKWDLCNEPLDLEALRERPCWLGVDMSSKLDLTAVVAIFEEGDRIDVLPFFFIPEEAGEPRERKKQEMYDRWIEAGLLLTTPGSVIDRESIRQKIHELNSLYEIQEIGCDPWKASELLSELNEDGLLATEVGQTVPKLTASTEELETLYVSRKLRHGGNPILKWCASNVTLYRDSNNNIKPDKKKSINKIDGISALVNALTIKRIGDGKTDFIYNKRGLYVG